MDKKQEFSLDIPKIGYVMVVRYDNYNFISDTIYKQQKKRGFPEVASRYVHVAISSGGPHAVNIMPPRSRLIDITKVYKGKYVRFLKYKDKDEEFDKKNRYKIAVLYNALCSNKKYDYTGVLSFIAGWIKQFSDRPFCSEGVTEAYQMIYPHLFYGKEPSFAMPADFLNEIWFDTVWEGYISK